MMNRRNTIITFLLTLLTISCYLPNQPGPMPSGIDEVGKNVKTNIFGVIRNDGLPGSSFIFLINCVNIEKGTPEEEPNVHRAIVKLINTQKDSVIIFHKDTSFSADTVRYAKYINNNFIPESNCKYLLKIELSDSEKIIDSTIVPSKPVINQNDIKIKDNNISITYYPPEFSEYSEFYFMPNILSTEFLSLTHNGIDSININVTSKIPLNRIYNLTVLIYSFDNKYFRYLKTSRNLLNHVYNPVATTLEGAYGCFFSLSTNIYKIKNIFYHN